MSDAEQRRLLLLADSLESQTDVTPPAKPRPNIEAKQARETVEQAAPKAEQRPDRLLTPRKQRRREALARDNVVRRADFPRPETTPAAEARRGRLAVAPAPAAPPMPTMPAVTPLPQLPGRRILEDLPPLPQRARKRSWAAIVSFLVFVMLPTIVASVYYIVYASNQYQVEFRFAVRETSQTGNAAGVASGLSALLATSAASNSAENYMVIDYLLSRQVVDELQEQIKVRDLYSRPNVDWWARFDPTQPMERFVKYWQHMVSAAYDQVTGVAAVQVRAFTPDDAHLIGVTMASLAERLVNQISQRPRLDAVKFAEQEVKRAEDRLREIRAQISEYRDKEAVIEPGSSVVTSQTTLASTLRATLTQYQTELSALTRQNLRPNAPHIVSLKSRINAVREQLAAVESQISTSRDGSKPLSKVVGQYEQLDLERQFAQTILTSAVQSLEQARANAIAQHLYVTPFVRPARPESSTYPNRLVSILTVGFACFFLWTIGLLVARSIGEHLA